MNKTTRITCHSSLVTAALAAAVAAAATSAAAYTVYDAGKALRQNITSGSPVGADGATYTDENGGKWQYLRANDNLATSTAPFNKSVTSGAIYRGIGGNSSVAGSPYIHVNISGAATRNSVTDGAVAAEPIDADELYVHPGNPSEANHFVVLRFIVPDAGYYSAFLTAHDVNGGGNANGNAGAEIRLLANNVMQVHSIVRLESYDAGNNAYLLTRRFDFQMPTRWMAAGETIDFMVGAIGEHNSDATGLKAFVTKEDDGAFYDSGLALNENILGSTLNPFGTTERGMWYCCYADTSTPRYYAGSQASCPPDYFAAWTPGQLTKKLTLLDSLYTFTNAPLITGYFQSTRRGSSPYICVNQTSANTKDIAPQELYTHPLATNWTQWTALRFRPPRGGMYSASIVLRDVSRENVGNPLSDGVMAYLLVGEKVVTNAVVCAEKLNSTAHFKFNARFMAANEPIDIIISPHNGAGGDATTISAIFRREADAYDAGYSMFVPAKANGAAPSRPFADALGGGATWKVGQTQSAKDEWSYADMPSAFKRVVNSVDYFGYGQNSTDGSLPRVMISTNGVAQIYDTVGSGFNDKFYRMSPCELWAHPNNSGNMCPVVRATVPEDGIYHMRAYARDISRGNNGILASVSVGGSIPAAQRVALEDAAYPYEAAIDGDRLWLKAGDSLDAVIDPFNNNHSNDGTCWSVCYIKEGDADADMRVVNVHITQLGSGKFSPTTQRPREGWSDWTTWNALRPGDAASAERRDCYDGDGTTQRNMTVTLTRDSGEAIAYGSSTDANIFSYALSSEATDTYTFTISQLAKNEPYSLYLYGAKSASTGGNATFTVGGVTKSLDETWIDDGGIKTLTRFDTVSDSDGVITGTFSAKDANGGAFNGLTLVGAFPEYKESAFVITVR